MTAEKDVQVARKKGRGEGGEVIRAMPERKHSFFQEVFPNNDMHYMLSKNRGTSLKFPSLIVETFFCATIQF